MRLVVASGYCCEHWRDVCACRTGCSGSLLLIVAIGVTIWLCRNREQRRADGKTDVGWIVFLVTAYLLSIGYLVFFVLLLVSTFTGESVTVG